MARRLLVLLATTGAALAAAVGLARRRGQHGASAAAGSRERTEKLHREIEAARARLRESIRTRDG